MVNIKVNSFYSISTEWQTIVLDGPDRYDYLHRLSSRSFKNPKVGESYPGAFLNANGTVISLFWVHLRENDLLLLVEKQSLEKTLAFLDKFHFGEKLSFKHEPAWSWFEIRGPSMPDSMSTKIPVSSWSQTKEFEFGILVDKIPSFDVKNMSDQEYDFYRMKNFIPKDQVDIGESQILLEAGLYTHLSRNKGCFPGQEVIERLFTYGNVAKKLVLFEIKGQVEVPPQTEIYLRDKKVGIVTSSKSLDDETQVFGVLQRTSALMGETYDIRLGTKSIEARPVIIAPDVPKD